MIKKIVIFILFLYSGFCFGQDEHKYLYIEQTNFEIPIKDSIRVFSHSKENKYEIEQIEPNLFKINCNNANIGIEISDKYFQIDLDKYSNDDKFINMSIFLRAKANSNDKIIFVKRGDLLKKYPVGKDENLCNIITFEYPKVIVIDEEYRTTINPIFSKYIFN